MKKFIVIVSVLCMTLSGCKVSCNEVSGDKTPVDQTATPSITASSSDWQVIEPEAGKISTKGLAFDDLEVTGNDYEFYGNLEENMRGGFTGGYEDEDRYRSLVCKDPVYDLTYFVNYGRDYYIYCIKNEEVYKVVEIPATELYCRSGELYFITNGYNCYNLSEVGEGSIMKYNPTNGEITTLVKESATRMRVYKDEIAYELVGSMQDVSDKPGMATVHNTRFVYSFNNNEAKEFPYSQHTLERINSEYVARIYSGENKGSLKLLSETERILEESEKLPDHYWQKDSYFYFISGSESLRLYRYSTENGQYEAVAEFPFGYENLMNSEFVIWNNIIYFGGLFRKDLSGEDTGTDLIFVDSDGIKRIDAFYTDGEDLYGVYQGKLWRIMEKEISSEDAEDAEDAVKEWFPGGDVYGRYQWSFENPTGDE